MNSAWATLTDKDFYGIPYIGPVNVFDHETPENKDKLFIKTPTIGNTLSRTLIAYKKDLIFE